MKNRASKVRFHYNTGNIYGKGEQTVDLIVDYDYTQEDLDEMTDDEFEKEMEDCARAWFDEQVEWGFHVVEES